jgi:serine/threonine protein kinase/tetratricopeptide (TPR) repeat protein
MGAVYKARHRLMDRMVAIKIVNPLLVTKPGAVERFIREVKAAAQLTHPNIVTAYDAETIGEMHVLVMEYVEGETLAELLQEQGMLNVAQACGYIRQAALGLQHAVDRGMVHRDIKPLNLMLTPQQSVKILDFGLARFVSEQTPLDGTTEHGSMMGSPDYMAPEQARDAHSADARADIYSLGCTLYQLLAGQVPFPGLPLLEKLEAHRDQQPPALNQIRVDVPADLERIIAKMTAKDPDERYQTPAEVAEALLPFTQPRQTHASAEPNPLKPVVGRKLKSNFPVGIAIVVAILLAGLGYWAAQVVFRVETPEGTLIVTTDDPDVQISIKSGGKEVALFFPKQQKEIPLKIGEYTLELVGGKEGLTLSANKFEIKSGSDEKTVTVEFVPTVAAKETPKSDEKAKTQADPTLPAIPSVEELLKTREVLTVSQDGSGGFTTIGEALDKVQAGQVVQVMDKGPYRELISRDLPADVALVSLVGTRIEIPKLKSYVAAQEKGKFWYYGAWLNVQGRFRLTGFEWVGAEPCPENYFAGRLLTLGATGDLVVEKCTFDAPDYLSALICFPMSDKPARLLVQDNVANNCLEFQAFPGSSIVQRNWISSPGLGMTVDQRNGNFLIRHNIVKTLIGIRLDGFAVDKARPAPGMDLRIHNNVLEVEQTPIYFWNESNETSALSRSAQIANNVFRSRTEDGVIMLPKDRDLVKGHWDIGPNAYQAEPKKAPGSPDNSWPTGPHDVILAEQFLSVEPEDTGYLRIAANGPLATGGTGGDLPSYFGAFPPGPAPKEGDWFTRMQEMKKLRAAQPYAADVINQARQALDANDFAKAMSLADEAVRMEPDYAEAHYLRGNTLYRQGKHVEAIPEFEKTLELNPMHESAMIELAWTLADTNPSDATIARLSKMLDHVSRGFVAAAIHNRRGNVWTLQGRFDKGMQDYEAGIKADPTAAGNYHGKSAILDRLGDHEAADAAWAETVKLIPAHDRMGWTKRLDDVVPLPVPLAEWREGREFLTVAQKGPADHRTIQDALNALKPGQYVKVLDKGPYRETIIHHRAISDYALVSEVGTRIEVPQWHKWGPSPNDKEKSIYQGCFLSSPNGLRLSGIEFHLPPLPPDADGVAAVEFAGAGDLIIESCQVRYHRDAVSDLPEIEKQHLGRFVGLTFGWFGEWTAVKKGRFLVQDNLIDGKVELRADGPVQVTVQRNWIRTSAPSASMELPFHAETECAIRHNLIQGPFGICLRARGPEKHELTTGRYLITNNLIDADNCPFWALPISIWPENERADRQTLSRAVTLQNNVIRSQKRSGLELSPDDLQAMTGVWKIGHNCFGAEPQHIGPSNFPAFPKQPTDLIVAGPFLSEDPQQADYLRIVADGRLATSGVGGNLPSYMGPLPPGPAPQGGDWFTRLREASAEKE